MENDFEIGVSQAAKLVHSSGMTVVNYIRKGIIKGHKNPITGVWKISLASVQQLIEKRNKEPKGAQD